jgi:4-amino-4-deoxy-L-arabinose transferase-like glycosyltransferase
VPAALKVSQSIVGALGVVLLGIIATRLAGPRAGVAAAFVAAVHPPLVWVSGYALSEGVFWPMGLLTVWLFDRGLSTGRAASGGSPGVASGWRSMFAAGLVAGAAVLVRPSMLFFLLLAGPWLLWRREMRLLLALAIGSALVILPWTARNYAHHGRLVVVASEGGVTFWTGNHPRATGDGDLAANPHLKLEQQALRARYPHLTEEQMEPIYYREAFAWMRAEPLTWLALEARKVFYLIVPVGPSYTLHSTLYVLASVIPYLLLLPIAVVGTLTMGARRAGTPGLWLLLGSAVVMSLAFFPQERFRIPIVDPVLIVLASAVIARAVPKSVSA